MRINRGAFFGVIFLAILIGGSATHYYQQFYPQRPWLPLRNMTGHDWMKMNQSERLFFSLGYSKGHFEGIKRACDIVSSFTGKLGAADPKGQASECLFKSAGQGDRVGFLPVNEQVSRFYELYPEERYWVVESLIVAFSDGESIEEFLENQPEGLVLD